MLIMNKCGLPLVLLFGLIFRVANYIGGMHDSVYAFDAADTNATPLWQVSFINPAVGIATLSTADVSCPDLSPEIGITSTPVIEPVSGTIYVEARTKKIISNVTSFYHRLHALNLATGVEKFFR